MTTGWRGGRSPAYPHYAIREVFMDLMAKRFGRTRESLYRVINEIRAERLGNILLSTVVEQGPKTDKGSLILSVVIPWLEIVRMIEEDPAIVFQIDPRKWEELIAGWYKKAGFDEVILTPRSADFGRDVIAIKHEVLSVRIIDQVKAYKPGHLVTANDVRAMAGVLSTDLSATKGLVTTTSDFAPMIEKDPSIAPLVPYRLELVNGSELRKRFVACLLPTTPPSPPKFALVGRKNR